MNKSLLIIAHFFRPEESSIYSSTMESMRNQRTYALYEAVKSWRAIFDDTATLNIEHKKFLLSSSASGALDIIIIVNENNHLIQSEFAHQARLKIVRVKTSNPRLLPFAAHRVAADYREQYDWFFYSEDDLAVRDPSFFFKLKAFQELFGTNRALQPNRYEINFKGTKTKTYIDGDLRAGFIEPYLKLVNEEHDALTLPFLGHTITLERARNPHSGFFALSSQQLKHWICQKHFNDLDSSFVSPLESAATLGLIKTFSVFKSSPPNQAYFEIEHLDRKFSSLKLSP